MRTRHSYFLRSARIFLPHAFAAALPFFSRDEVRVRLLEVAERFLDFLREPVAEDAFRERDRVARTADFTRPIPCRMIVWTAGDC